MLLCILLFIHWWLVGPFLAPAALACQGWCCIRMCSAGRGGRCGGALATSPPPPWQVWALYTKFVKDLGVWQTAVKVYRRYIMFDPAYREEYTAYLISIGQFDEGAKQISHMVNDDKFVSLKGTSKHAMWLQLCDIITKHPDKVSR